MACVAGPRERSLSRLAVGNHAAADHRESGRPVLREIHRAMADRHGAGLGLPRRCSAHVGGAWLLFARTQPSRLRCRRAARPRRHFSRLRGRPACAAGYRALHGGGDCSDCVRRQTMPVDGNIERVVSRLFAVEEALPKAKPQIQQFAATLLGLSRAGDSAQALMDLGATICTPKKPGLCAVSAQRQLRGARAWRSGDVSAQGAEKDRHAAARRGIRRHPRRRAIGPHARRKRIARQA